MGCVKCGCLGFLLCEYVYMWVLLCVGVCKGGFCNVWVLYVWVCVYVCGCVCVGFVICGCVFVWVL